MVAWERFKISDPGHPTLIYDEDLVTLLLHYGLFEELWKFIDLDREASGFLVTWLRVFRTDNGRRFRCDSRVQDLSRELEIPPSVVPDVCN